jgi:hypothetical protein
MPGFKCVGTSLPVDSITAPISCPGMTGSLTIGFLPEYVLRSEPQNPTYLIFNNTSFEDIEGAGMSATFTSPACTICIAFIY